MITEHIDLAKAKELIERAIEERSADYVYVAPEAGSCVYFRDGKPSCIVGLALLYVGLTAEEVVDCAGNVGVDVNRLIEKLGVKHLLTIEAIDLLDAVQDRQDSKEPWGTAYRRALQELEDVDE